MGVTIIGKGKCVVQVDVSWYEATSSSGNGIADELIVNPTVIMPNDNKIAITSCIKTRPETPTTGMSYATVHVPPGWGPSKSREEMQRDNEESKRVETSPNAVTIYYDSFHLRPRCFSIELNRFRNIKTSNKLKLFASPYYDDGLETTTTVTLPEVFNAHVENVVRYELSVALVAAADKVRAAINDELLESDPESFALLSAKLADRIRKSLANLGRNAEDPDLTEDSEVTILRTLLTHAEARNYTGFNDWPTVMPTSAPTTAPTMLPTSSQFTISSGTSSPESHQPIRDSTSSDKSAVVIAVVVVSLVIVIVVILFVWARTKKDASHPHNQNREVASDSAVYAYSEHDRKADIEI